MEKLVKPARLAFCAGLAGMVIPDFIYGVFGDNFMPVWPHLPLIAFWSCLFNSLVVVGCGAIVFSSNPRTAALLLGALLLAVYLFGYFTFDAFVAKYNNHLGTWGDGLKEPALAGGAFVAAGTLPAEPVIQKFALLKFLQKLIPFGPFLFCTTIFLYGLVHMLYGPMVATLVPDWIPWHVFWAYFAGVALMVLAIAVTFKIKRKEAALLLALTILMWIFLIHLPRAINDPYGNNSNEPISAFSAVAFCGIALMISGMAAKKPVKI